MKLHKDITRKVILFGAGQRAKCYISKWKWKKISILFICDNDLAKIGTDIMGIPIVHPNQILNYPEIPVFITIQNSEAIEKQLIDMGILNFYKIDSEMFNIFKYSFLKFDYKNSENISKNIQDNNVTISIVIVGDSVLNCTPAYNSVMRFVGELDAEVVQYHGNNVKVSGEKVLLLDEADWLQEGAIEALLDLTNGKSTPNIIGSKIVSVEGTIFSAGMVKADVYKECLRGRDFFEPLANYVRECNAVDFSGMLLDYSNWIIWKEMYETQQLHLFWDKIEKENIVIYQPQSVIVRKEKIEKEEISVSDVELFFDVRNCDSRKHMIIVDNAVSKFDQNTGARCVSQYIEIFQKLNMNILYIPMNFAYEDKYTNYFQQKGICVLYGEFYRNKYTECIAHMVMHIDYAFLNRPFESDKVIKFLRKNHKMVISYFGHDLHHKRMMREYELTRNDKMLEAAIEMERLEHRIISEVDYAGYPSQVEVDYLKEQHDNVYYYPLYYFKQGDIISYESTRKGIVFVGGFSHKPNVDGALWFKNEIYPELKRLGYNAPIYIVGSNAPQEILEMNNGNIHVTGFISDEELAKLLLDCKLTFVPLRFGAGMKGKVLEAMYAGLPVVTTTIGAEGLDIIEAGIEVADTGKEFAELIIKIYEDDSLARKKSIDAQRYIHKYFGEEQLKCLFANQIKRK